MKRNPKNRVEEENLQRRKPTKKIKKSKPKKVMSERKKRFIRKFNTLFVIAYIIFSVYRVISYFSWKNMVQPMMKNECSIVVDDNGNVVDKIGGERIKDNVSISEIPDNLKNAYIDIEDERFYSHKGVDVKRTSAAIGSYILHAGKSSFGGSTITQQLVKNLTGNDDNSITRKVGEWVKSYELESFTSKEQILETYFNIIYIGPNVYGVGAGSRYYFNKNVSELSIAECAYLAGINVSPNSYNPFDGSDNSEKIKKRTKIVLEKMHDLNHISDEDFTNAIQEVDNGLRFNNGKLEPEGSHVYSYYTDSVMNEVIDDISNKKKISQKFATNYLYMSGSTIHSTENSEVQAKLEKEYEQNKYVIISENGQTSQSAMVILDHKTGHVKAVVGGLGEKTTSRGFNRATQAYRQTGSAIKPIAVLAPGIDKKLFTASTVYNDEVTTFEDGFSPKDNNNIYLGNITVRRAVESSQNIPFVKMMQQVTPQTSIKYLQKMGISNLTDGDVNLSLALGGLEKGSTPLEMAGAYGTIANDGIYIEPTFYTNVINSDGKVVIKSKQKKTKVFSKEVAYIIKELLKQPVEGESGTAKPCRIEGMDVAAKTGTTDDNYDKWLCGFTTYYTAVTWYGYDNNENIAYKGKSPAVLLWSEVMKDVHSNLPKTSFAKPSKVKQAEVCSVTGNLANSKCTDTHTEYFLFGTLPGKCVECTGTTKQPSQPAQPKNENKNTTENSTIKNETQTNTANQAKNETQTNNVNQVNAVNKSTTVNNTNTTKQTTNNTEANNTVNNTQNKSVQSNKIINTQQNQNTTTNQTGNKTNTTQTNITNNTTVKSNNSTTDDEEDDGP